jgi:hypothetical protein
MTTRRLVTSTLLAIALAGGFVRGSDGAKPSTPSPGEPTLSELRLLTERFRDVNATLAEGYIRDPCRHLLASAARGRIQTSGCQVS